MRCSTSCTTSWAVYAKGGSPRVTGDAGREAVSVAEAILDSIRTHQWEGRPGGPVGPLAVPEPPILRGPHWHLSPKPDEDHREAG